MIPLIMGTTLGMGLMYLMDPEAGNRRRAMLRDQTIAVRNRTGRFLDKAARDVRNRGRGIVIESTRSIREDHVDDEVLRERIRSKLGRHVSHPHAIHVEVRDGHVLLSGSILAAEAQRTLAMVTALTGVRQVENRLDVHEHADIPALQGGVPAPGEPSERRQSEWSPAFRAVAGLTGLGLMAMGRGFLGMPMRLVGAGLVARSLKPHDGNERAWRIA